MSMTVAPVRSGNPGIVPEWLQGTRPSAPSTDVTEPSTGRETGSGTPPSATPGHSRRESPVDAARAGAEEIEVVVYPVPIGTGATVPSRPVSGVLRREDAPEGPEAPEELPPTKVFDEAAESTRLRTKVDEVRDFFRDLGVRDDEGNDAGIARFNPRYPNASYSPVGIPEKRVPADSITVGVIPREGRSLVDAEDVVAHEWAHRIIHHMTGGQLESSPLAGDNAVHESLADTFAAAFDSEDWSLGEDVGKPMRVLDKPEQLGHPGSVADLERIFGPGGEGKFIMPVGTDQRGRLVLVPDPHVVAAVPNKAAALIGEELGRDTMAKIYVNALRDHLEPGGAIGGLATAVMQSAEELYGADSRELSATKDAWRAVGLLSNPGTERGAGGGLFIEGGLAPSA